MTMHGRKARGFTLVEILIVVVILGILAAIVIPQFSNASNEAAVSSTQSQLQTLRSQIELYRVRNLGEWPISADSLTWDNLLDPADDDQEPYIQSAPINPFTGQSGIVAGEDHTAGNPETDGWVWNDDEHMLFAVGFDEATGEYTAPGGGG